jgi:phosphatidylglycerol:prolipoprotein diacylglycerol transferase
MHPILFSIGPITIHTYGFFVALGLLVGISLGLRESRKVGYEPQALMDTIFYIVLAGIIGSRVFYVAQNFSAYAANPLDILKLWEGGLVFYGALLGGLPVGWYFMKRHGYAFWTLFDVFAPSIAVGQAFGRIGCFFAGCCYGCRTDVPWAVTFTHPQSLAPRGIPLHPTQLYTSFALFAIFIILYGLRNRTRFSGQLASIYLMLHSMARFSVEFFRDDARPYFEGMTISVTQIISIGLFVVGISSYLVLSKRHTSKRSASS